jgi:Rab GDP dissociation inhibitor
LDTLLSFESVSDLVEPIADGSADNCFISKSYDAASHFEGCANDVLSMYKRITGTDLDMNISAEMTEEDM